MKLRPLRPEALMDRHERQGSLHAVSLSLAVTNIINNMEPTFVGEACQKVSETLPSCGWCE